MPPTTSPDPVTGGPRTARALARVLVVDDNPDIRRLFGIILEKAGYEITFANNGNEALERLELGPFDLVITDLAMPEREGIETIGIIRRLHPKTKIIAVSGAFDGRMLSVAGTLGANATLAKPVDPDDLVQTVRDVLTC